MDAKRFLRRQLTRVPVAIAIALVLAAFADAGVALAHEVGLSLRSLVRFLVSPLPGVGLLIVLVALVATMLDVLGRPGVPPRASRTRNWYLTRIELAIGIVAGVVLLAFIVLVALPASMDPMFDGSHSLWPGGILTLAAGSLGMLVGLGWMIRLFRGSHDEPPPWRYRDR